MALLFTLLLGVCASLLAYFLVDAGRQTFIRESEAAIHTHMQHTIALTQPMSLQQRQRSIADISAASQQPKYFLQSAEGQRLAGNLHQLPQQAEPIREGLLRFTDENKQEMAASIHTYSDGSRLMIARDITAINTHHSKLKHITMLVIGFMVVVVGVSFFISIFVVRRINIIAKTAQDIIRTSDLSRRIAVQGSWDDLSNLSQILNQLLAQIEQLMQGIRNVSDAIAHDLRTPITRLRHVLEQAQQLPPEAQGEPIHQALHEVDGILTTFNALLRITSIENGKRHQSFATTDMSSLLHDVCELYEPVAESRSITLQWQLPQGCTLQADKDLLFQAFVNLLDNALKFTPDGGAITLSLTPCASPLRYEMTLSDNGAGVPDEADRAKLGERFFRADKSRSTQGTGLGLSLVKAILDLHRARIRFEDNAPGLRVIVTF